MFSLDGKVVIVTGASSGLGVAFAKGCAQAGADVVLAARRVEKLSETAALVTEAGKRALSVQTDVTDPDQCQAMVDRAMEEFGHVDVLVNNAGIGTAVPATRETPEEFRAVVDINLHGSYWAAQACARVMQPGSSIVNISSILGLTTAGLPQAAYAASKAAIVGLTRDLAQQWGSRKGIRVNAIAPGPISTAKGRLSQEQIERIEKLVPIGRFGEASEFAAAVALLASDQGGFFVGATLDMNGGLFMR